MSGASEATLQELLSVNKDMANAIRGLANSSGGSGGGGGGGAAGKAANKSLDALSKTSQGVGTVFGALTTIIGGTFSKAISVASAGLNAFAKVGGAVLASQKQLAEASIDGANNIASFASSLSNLPYGLGLVAQAVAYQEKVTLKNLTTFQELSKSGVNLGGNLNTVRESAKSMGLSMDEFSTVMKAQSAQFGRMGATAEEGARNMINFNKSFVRGETGRELGNLGLTAVELNNAMGNFAEISGGISQDQLKDQKALSSQIKSYNEELIMTAELTGKNREEMEKEMKERAKNAARDLALSQMTGEEKKRFLAAEQAAMRVGGKGAADALLSMTLGLPPMTKEARTFTAVNGQANKEIVKLNQATKDKSLSEAQFTKQIDDSTAKGQKATRDMVKGYGQTANALAFQSGAVADTMKDSMHQVAADNAAGVKSEEDYRNRVGKTREGILKAEKEGTAGAANQRNMAAKYQGEIMEKLYAALAQLWPIVLDVVTAVTDLVVAGIPLIKKAFAFIGNIYSDVIKPAFKALFGGISFDDITAPFKALFKGLFGEEGMDIKGVGQSVAGFLGKVRKFFGDMFGAIDFEAVGKSIRETFTKVFGALGKVASALGKLFGGGGGADGAAVGSGLQKAWTTLMDIIGGIADMLGDLIEKFTATPAFETMQEIVASVVKIFTGIVNILKKIVAGPVGTWLVGALSAAFELFITPFKFLITAIEAVVDIVEGIVDMLTGDVQGGFDKIIDGIKTFIHGIVDKFAKFTKFVLGLFGLGDWANKINDSIKSLFDGIIDFFAGFAKKVLGWFSSGSDDAKAKAQAKTPETPAAQQPDPTKWAHDVYVKSKDMSQVPGEIKGQVQALINKPPQAWVDEVNKKQQSNNQAKTEPKPEEKKAEAPKPAAAPVVDLNNKDAVAILKAIADYQRRTVDAVNGLNGNLYKRA